MTNSNPPEGEPMDVEDLERLLLRWRFDDMQGKNCKEMAELLADSYISKAALHRWHNQQAYKEVLELSGHEPLIYQKYLVTTRKLGLEENQNQARLLAKAVEMYREELLQAARKRYQQ